MSVSKNAYIENAYIFWILRLDAYKNNAYKKNSSVVVNYSGQRPGISLVSQIKYGPDPIVPNKVLNGSYRCQLAIHVFSFVVYFPKGLG